MTHVSFSGDGASSSTTTFAPASAFASPSPVYFLAPVLALFLVFLPMSGAGLFGLQKGGPMFTVYLLLINLPFGIVTALAARAIIGGTL